MHSLGESVVSAGAVPPVRTPRRIVEGVLRAIALLLVLWALVNAWRAASGAVPAAHLSFNGAPTALTRDSLAAHKRVGDQISWAGTLAPLAAMVEPVREPGGQWRVSVAGPDEIGLSDSLGAIDSLGAGERSLTMSAAHGVLRVTSGTTVARALPTDDVVLGRVAVFGRAGWESKFVIAAIEEAGWGVDARLTLGRDREVRQGDPTPRLGRHSVVVLLDTLAGTDAVGLARFVRAGGGLVLGGLGARVAAPALRAIAPARVVATEPPETREFDGLDGHDPTHALPLHVLGAVRTDAVVLSSREGSPAIAVRRVGAGRVAQLGFGETWRWRMQGGERGIRDHRAYWSRLVGSVAAEAGASALAKKSADADANANANANAAADRLSADGAPLSQLVHTLGPATVAPRGLPPRGPVLPVWIGAAILLAALAEWASRRSRGAI